ncbi:MAG: chemotaxis protein CheD [Candidatus Hydrogenedentes bacterium]|nr:chemotaxis protein CheD [Candidatus Hydrogenedentota bacterium]
MKQTIGISDYRISDAPEDELITYSLGSCIGLSLYDRTRKIGGLIHCMLPLSRIDPERARAKPAMFTDTGIMRLIEELLEKGAERRRLIARAAGAARLLENQGAFRIGDRNQVVLRKILWKNNILLESEDVGGTCARTMSLRISDGVTSIRSAGNRYDLT